MANTGEKRNKMEAFHRNTRLRVETSAGGTLITTRGAARRYGKKEKEKEKDLHHRGSGLLRLGSGPMAVLTSYLDTEEIACGLMCLTRRLQSPFTIDMHRSAIASKCLSFSAAVKTFLVAPHACAHCGCPGAGPRAWKAKSDDAKDVANAQKYGKVVSCCQHPVALLAVCKNEVQNRCQPIDAQALKEVKAAAFPMLDKGTISSLFKGLDTFQNLHARYQAYIRSITGRFAEWRLDPCFVDWPRAWLSSWWDSLFAAQLPGVNAIHFGESNPDPANPDTKNAIFVEVLTVNSFEALVSCRTARSQFRRLLVDDSKTSTVSCVFRMVNGVSHAISVNESVMFSLGAKWKQLERFEIKGYHATHHEKTIAETNQSALDFGLALHARAKANPNTELQLKQMVLPSSLNINAFFEQFVLQSRGGSCRCQMLQCRCDRLHVEWPVHRLPEFALSVSNWVGFFGMPRCIITSVAVHHLTTLSQEDLQRLAGVIWFASRAEGNKDWQRIKNEMKKQLVLQPLVDAVAD